MAEKQAPNHVLHLLLSIVTLGLWVPVWILLTAAAGFSPFYCPTCAARTQWEGAADTGFFARGGFGSVLLIIIVIVFALALIGHLNS